VAALPARCQLLLRSGCEVLWPVGKIWPVAQFRSRQFPAGEVPGVTYLEYRLESGSGLGQERLMIF
jgi:hypothetical protein